MTAESIAASVVNTLSLQGRQTVPQGYFRSKIFITPFTTNPLVAAAGPLFSLLERLNISPILPAIEKIRESIEHELHAFHSRLRGQIDNEEIHAIAQYLLTATIDELVGKTCLKHGNVALSFKAFTPTSYDNIGPEKRFFLIIHHLKESPNQYLDLLELAYYCLIAGFEGSEHGKPDGRQVLDNLLEDLYQLISQYRVNQTYKLFNPPKKIVSGPKSSYKPMLIMGLISLSIVLASYFISYTLLEVKARSVQFGHAVTAQG